ncbi:MAG: hypothetical protein PVJ40_05575 [Gammaproteobacteria bacterium]|jgi:hypothetical protein
MNTIPTTLLLAAFAFAAAGCESKGPETAGTDAQTGAQPATQIPAETPPTANVVELVARGRQFQGPDSISSGWTTFHFSNNSAFTHFAVLERLPDGFSIKEQQEQVAPIFQAGMDLLARGENEAAMQKFGEVPEWFSRVVYLGGPGLTAPGKESTATVDLAPGTYLIECYVKTKGIFHSFNPVPGKYGMVHQLTVTGPRADDTPPKADLDITLSSENGIAVQGNPTAGRHTVAVHFLDQKTYANFAGHDVHLVRLSQDTDEKAVAAWMDWMQPDGLNTPAPADFLGGLEEMPAGSTGYFTVTLQPGRYAWVAEVPHPDEHGMFKVFVVPRENTL